VLTAYGITPFSSVYLISGNWTNYFRLLSPSDNRLLTLNNFFCYETLHKTWPFPNSAKLCHHDASNLVSTPCLHYIIKQYFLICRPLKTTLAHISASTNACKQSAVTFEVLVLWLCNQHYYTRDVIGTYRDLPNYEVIRVETCCEYKLHKNKHKNHANSIAFRKWS